MPRKKSRTHARAHNFFRPSLILGIVVALTACASVKDAYLVDSLTREQSDVKLSDNPLLLGGQYVPGPIDLYTMPFPGDTNPTMIPKLGVTPTAVGCARTR